MERRPPADGGNGLLSDQLLNFWPWRLYMRSELLHGRFPLWNPLIAGGVPFAGCVQAAPFFPTSLLLAALPPAAWSLAAAFLKLFAAGFLTSLHARRLGAGRTGAAGDFDFYSSPEKVPPQARLLALSAVAATPRLAAGMPKDWRRVGEGDISVFRAPQPGRRAVFAPAARSASSAEVDGALPLRAVVTPDRLLAGGAGRSCARRGLATGLESGGGREEPAPVLGPFYMGLWA